MLYFWTHLVGRDRECGCDSAPPSFPTSDTVKREASQAELPQPHKLEKLAVRLGSRHRLHLTTVLSLNNIKLSWASLIDLKFFLLLLMRG